MTHKLTTDTLINYKDHYYTGSDIKAMREWIGECEWADMPSDEIKDLTSTEVLIGIKRNFEGGLSAFLNTIQ